MAGRLTAKPRPALHPQTPLRLTLGTGGTGGTGDPIWGPRSTDTSGVRSMILVWPGWRVSKVMGMCNPMPEYRRLGLYQHYPLEDRVGKVRRESRSTSTSEPSMSCCCTNSDLPPGGVQGRGVAGAAAREHDPASADQPRVLHGGGPHQPRAQCPPDARAIPAPTSTSAERPVRRKLILGGLIERIPARRLNPPKIPGHSRILFSSGTRVS